MDFFRGAEITKVSLIPDGEDGFGKDTFTEVEEVIENAIVAFRSGRVFNGVVSVAEETVLNLILPEGTVVEDGDFFILKGRKWEVSEPMNDYYGLEIQDRFIPRPTVVSIKLVRNDS